MERERAAQATDGEAPFAGAFFYLSALLLLFSLHNAFIFNEDLLGAAQAFALLNGLVLATVAMRIGGSRAAAGRFVTTILTRSALLAGLLVALQTAEAVTVGLWRGQSAVASLPTMGDGSLQAILIQASLLFVGLLPFFALLALGRAIGPGEMRTLLFGPPGVKSASGEHEEKHFLNSETVRDVVIGMADGLTVPFALAAGISAAIASTRVVVTAGLAEIVAGAIAMGLGGYLAARSDHEHFLSEEKREYAEIEKLPEQERKELREIFAQYGLDGPEVDGIVSAISADRTRWVDFMMRFELGLEKPDPKRAPISAATIAAAYATGGLIPLAPYIVEDDIHRALTLSAIVTGVALLVFGAVKGRLTGADPIRAGLQTFLVGGLAAGAAFYLASLFG
jgi:VIT1/CCC1 family predicted Fe2+/Mn2+ transporter